MKGKDLAEMEDAEIADETTVELQPVRNVKLRIIITVICMTLVLLTGAGWLPKIIWCLMLVLSIGTFPVVKLAGSKFERQMRIGFLPMRIRRWSLEKFLAIETGTSEDEPLGGLFAMFFFKLWLMKKIVDFAFPWMGGELKLWLRGKRGGRILAWEGNNINQFDHNRDLLALRLGLPIERR